MLPSYACWLSLRREHGVFSTANIKTVATKDRNAFILTIIPLGVQLYPHNVNNVGLSTLPSKSLKILVFALFNDTFITMQVPTLRIANPIIRSMASTYLGASSSRKKYGLQIFSSCDIRLISATAAAFFSAVWFNVDDAQLKPPALAEKHPQMKRKEAK